MRAFMRSLGRIGEGIGRASGGRLWQVVAAQPPESETIGRACRSPRGSRAMRQGIDAQRLSCPTPLHDLQAAGGTFSRPNPQLATRGQVQLSSLAAVGWSVMGKAALTAHAHTGTGGAHQSHSWSQSYSSPLSHHLL